MNESTFLGTGNKIPVTVRLDRDLVCRIGEMKNRCAIFNESFSVTEILVRALVAELDAKERLCQNADHTLIQLC